MNAPKFHLIAPGARLPGDWFPGTVPSNIQVGENCVVDSSFSFKHFCECESLGLRVGRDVTFWRTSLAVEESGFIEIGDCCFLSNASLVCSHRITIGSRVFIAGGATLADSDFHPLGPAARIADTIALSPLGNRRIRPSITSAAVTIEDDVYIGFNCTILKGVTIGAGATIEPGAVVLRDVASGARMAGNPAREQADL